MSVEKALEELAEAVRENTEVLKTMIAGAKAAVASKTAAKSEDDGEKAKPATRKATAPKTKVPTAKELSAKTSAYLEIDDEDEYEARKAIIKKIVAKFDAPKMSEIEEENRAEAMDLLDQAIAGKDPFKKARRDDDEDFA